MRQRLQKAESFFSKPTESDALNWTHDRFNEVDQKPKTKKELVHTYGFDLRSAKSCEKDIVRRTPRPERLNLSQAIKFSLGLASRPRREKNADVKVINEKLCQESVENQNKEIVDIVSPEDLKPNGQTESPTMFSSSQVQTIEKIPSSINVTKSYEISCVTSTNAPSKLQNRLNRHRFKEQEKKPTTVETPSTPIICKDNENSVDSSKKVSQCDIKTLAQQSLSKLTKDQQDSLIYITGVSSKHFKGVYDYFVSYYEIQGTPLDIDAVHCYLKIRNISFDDETNNSYPQISFEDAWPKVCSTNNKVRPLSNTKMPQPPQQWRERKPIMIVDPNSKFTKTCNVQNIDINFTLENMFVRKF